MALRQVVELRAHHEGAGTPDHYRFTRDGNPGHLKWCKDDSGDGV